MSSLDTVKRMIRNEFDALPMDYTFRDESDRLINIAMSYGLTELAEEMENDVLTELT